jgi:hypothetical protein
MTEKSILEQALLQVQTLEEAVKQNAKGILASTMKQELNDLLKESLEEEDEVKETESPVDPMDEQAEDDETNPEEEGDDMSDEEAADDEVGADDAENDTDLDNEPSKDVDSMDSEEGGDEEMPAGDEFGDEPSFEDGAEGDDDVMDMTGASDEEVLKVFKAMKPEDGIVVKKDGNHVELGTGDDEYIIKLDGEESSEVEEMDVDSEMSEEPAVDDEEIVYEIELGEDEDEEAETMEGDDNSQEMEATEAAHTKWNAHGGDRAGIKSKKLFKAGSKAINEEVENLKKQNAEYKKALVLFKEKLNEVAVFNANLAYATRLFTEHSTTKQEKLNILKRFDSISTMNEAKNLFNTIKAELGTKTTVTETVVEKISNTPTSSSSQEVLSEAKAYENPQFRRMKDLMAKIK